jgi:hypothetical protein
MGVSALAGEPVLRRRRMNHRVTFRFEKQSFLLRRSGRGAVPLYSYRLYHYIFEEGRQVKRKIEPTIGCSML